MAALGLERMAAGALAGAAAGVLVGIAARISMRSVALGLVDASMQVPIFTVSGTLFILTIGAIVGAPFGVGYALLDLGRTRILRGLAYAALMIAAFGPLFFLGTDEFFSSGRVAVFVWLFPIFGVGASLLFPLAARAARSLPASGRAAILTGAAAGAGLIMFGVVTLLAQSIEKNGPTALGLVATWPALLVLAVLIRRARPVVTTAH